MAARLIGNRHTIALPIFQVRNGPHRSTNCSDSIVLAAVVGSVFVVRIDRHYLTDTLPKRPTSDRIVYPFFRNVSMI